MTDRMVAQSRRIAFFHFIKSSSFPCCAFCNLVLDTRQILQVIYSTGLYACGTPMCVFFTRNGFYIRIVLSKLCIPSPDVLLRGSAVLDCVMSILHLLAAESLPFWLHEKLQNSMSSLSPDGRERAFSLCASTPMRTRNRQEQNPRLVRGRLQQLRFFPTSPAPIRLADASKRSFFPPFFAFHPSTCEPDPARATNA